MIYGGPEWEVVPLIDDGCHPRLGSQLCRLWVALGASYDVNFTIGTPQMPWCARNIRSNLPVDAG
jgi:hypothetical protein